MPENGREQVSGMHFRSKLSSSEIFFKKTVRLIVELNEGTATTCGFLASMLQTDQAEANDVAHVKRSRIVAIG